MSNGTDTLFVLTGGPGAGKTTLIEALADAGHATCLEAGRGIIRDQTAVDGPALPCKDPALFAEMMLSWELRSHHAAAGRERPVFLDRGVPDVIGYLLLCGLPVPAHMWTAAERFRYNPTVFVAPPWRAIYRQDGERRQTWDEAVRTHDLMVETWHGLGYRTIALPCAPVEERLRFVLGETGLEHRS